MNFLLLTIAFLILVLNLILLIPLIKFFKYQLTSIEIKEKGFLYCYQIILDSLIRPQISSKKLIFIAWAHYFTLHIFTPIFLSAFILKNDWNVLIAIISIILSMNIFQKIYPANLYMDKTLE